MIWTTSDWHYDHNKDFIYGARKYATVDEMNEDIFTQTNARVEPNDLLVFNGDMAMGVGRDNEPEYVKTIGYILDRLNCKNVLWVGGNHDRLFVKRGGELVRNLPIWRMMRWRSQCVNCMAVWPHTKLRKGECVHCKGREFEPVEGIYPMGMELRLSGKLCAEHGIPEKYKEVMVTFSHYSHRVWNKSHHNRAQVDKGRSPRSINLYGHSHGGLPGIFCSFDSGWDVWRRPISIVEVLDKLMPEHNASEPGKIYFGHHE